MDLAEGHEGTGSHGFCRECTRKCHEQATGHLVIEEGKDSCTFECPVRTCRKLVNLTKFAAETYKDNFDKYKKTAILGENPFAKSNLMAAVEEKKDSGPKKGKCFVPDCNVTKGYYEKSSKCAKTCAFFFCKDHWDEGCAKLKENKNACPGCGAKYLPKEIMRFKKKKEETTAAFNPKDMEYEVLAEE